MSSRRILLTLLAFAALFTWAPLARATSCRMPELASSTADADLIFVATAGSSTTIPGGRRTSLRVKRVFKGTVPGAIEVEGGGMKGAAFEAGQSYLVFALLPDGGATASRPFVHLCSGTARAADVAEWIASFGDGEAPAKAGTPIRSGNDGAKSAPGTASATPSTAPPAETAAPIASAAPSVAPPSTVTPSTASPATTTETPPSEPVSGGGCAGCATAASAPGATSAWPWGVVAFVAGCAAARRRRSVLASASAA